MSCRMELYCPGMVITLMERTHMQRILCIWAMLAIGLPALVLAVTGVNEEVQDFKMVISNPSNCYYTYDPKEDITTYELARLMPLLINPDSYLKLMYQGLPESAKRHLIPSSEDCK
jgi:hypothetical protein